MQDSKGFMWFGTEDGLNRYDGYQFTVYRNKADDKFSISNNFIRFLFEDHTGNIWIATEGGGLNRYNREKNQFVRYLHNPEDNNSLSNDNVWCVYESPDARGELWVGTGGGGLDKLVIMEDDKVEFTHYQNDPQDETSLSTNYIWKIFPDPLNTDIVWIATVGGGLNKFNRKTGKTKRYIHGKNDPNSLSNNFVFSIHISPNEPRVLWIGTGGGGLNRFDSRREVFIRYQFDPQNPKSIGHNYIRTILEEKEGQQTVLWLGTGGRGVDKLYIDPSETSNAAKAEFIHFRHDPTDLRSLSNNSINQIYRDKTGVIWIATDLGGLNKFVPGRGEFQLFVSNPNDKNSLSDNRVTALHEGKSGNLWIGTLSGGLNKFDRKNGRFERFRRDYKNSNSLSNNFVRSIYEDEAGMVWVGTEQGGLNKYNPKTREFKHFKHDPENPQSIGFNYVFSIHQDSENDNILWVAVVGSGLDKFDKQKEVFYHYRPEPDNPNSLSSSNVLTIYEDASGMLWIGTDDGGLNRFSPKTEIFTRFLKEPDNPNSLSDNTVSSVYESPDLPGILWIGTEFGGLNKFNLIENKFTHYKEEDGLPGNKVVGVVGDGQGNIWMTTQRGLSRFDPIQETFRNFDIYDGLQGNEFNLGAFCKSKSGEMFVGGTNGFNAFFPEEIMDNPSIPAVVITDFQIYNESVPIGTFREDNRKSPLEKNITETKEITLSHKIDVISFEFASLDYSIPQKNQYAYWMEGFEKSWNYSGNRRFATYTNLDPGEYVFRVKGSNSDGVWNEEESSIKITITPPWWQTYWAYTLFAIILSSMVIAIRRYDRKRAQLRHDLKMQRFEAQKLMEVDQLKTHFFANISHEFRTPLTLILGILEKSISEITELKSKEDHQVMHRNASRLLQLINQLLDLSKLEAGSLKLQAVKADIIKFVRRHLSSFASLGEQKKIILSFNDAAFDAQSGESAIYAYFDPDKMEKVFYNLLSNAFKFTPEGGRINIIAAASDQTIEIGVSNSGPGIPEDQLPHIFDRFYQVEDGSTRQYEGTGIGLALAKELIEMHHGQISVESVEGKMTTFTIKIPLGKQNLKEEEIVIEDMVEIETPIKEEAVELNSPFNDPSGEAGGQRQMLDETIHTVESEDAPVILIIEDHLDLRQFICSHLRNDYNIIQAENGAVGSQKAEETIPDLVISDVMMPEMDGYELCQKLRSDPKTSHIPVILLTARATDKDKMEGLETGADDYLIKPFNPEELKVRVRNLIRLRQQMREKFSSEMLLRPTEVVVPSAQKIFLERITEIIEEHLDDENFGVEILGGEIGMSRAQIHRKLKALTNKSATELIRSFRLQRAAQLIKQDAGNIAEIAYQVGFNSQAYFTRSFQEEFGCSPTEFRKKFCAEN
jgi:signal transduction histidine kinase/DNA-binding response OmpR family regulator/ligand-binding sensor domain-containing protein